MKDGSEATRDAGDHDEFLSKSLLWNDSPLV